MKIECTASDKIFLKHIIVFIEKFINGRDLIQFNVRLACVLFDLLYITYNIDYRYKTT